MVPPVPEGEWEKSVLLASEREMLGLYVSDHPLFGVEHILAKSSDCTVSQLTGDDGRPDGATVVIAGMISSLQRKLTKNGNPWAIATVEDLGGAIEVLFFPQTYQTVLHVLAEDLVVVVKGRVNRRDDVPTIYAQELTIPDLTVSSNGPVVLSMPVSRCTPPTVGKLKDVLVNHPVRARCTCAWCSRGARPRCVSTTGCGSLRHRPCSVTSRRCSAELPGLRLISSSPWVVGKKSSAHRPGP